MTLNDIAKAIPVAERREILTLDLISKAQAIREDSPMFYLFTIWKRHVEPYGDLSLECPACLQRILKFFHAVAPILQDLERASRLFDSIES